MPGEFWPAENISLTISGPQIHRWVSGGIPTPPTVVGAECIGPRTVVVSFSKPVFGPLLSAPDAWDVTPRDGLADKRLIQSIVRYGEVSVLLTFDAALTTGGHYVVKPPLSLHDESGLTLDPRYARAFFIVPPFDTKQSETQPFLVALTAILGRIFGRLTDGPTTTLAATLSADSNIAIVRSTLGFPQQGGWIRIGPELAYGVPVAGDRFNLTVRTAWLDHAPGTPVLDVSRSTSILDVARRQLHIATAQEDPIVAYLAVHDYGLTPPYDWMSKEDIRNFVLTHTSLPGGSWPAVYAGLSAALAPFAVTTTGTLYYDGPSLVVPANAMPSVSQLFGRCVTLTTKDNTSVRFLIASAAQHSVQVRLQLESQAGLWWSAAPGPFADGENVPVKLDAFRLAISDYRPRRPSTFLYGHHNLSTALVGGYLSEDHFAHPALRGVYPYHKTLAVRYHRRYALIVLAWLPGAVGNYGRRRSAGANPSGYRPGGYVRSRLDPPGASLFPAWVLSTWDRRLQDIAPAGVALLVAFLDSAQRLFR